MHNAEFESWIGHPPNDLEFQFPHLSNSSSYCIEGLERLNRMMYIMHVVCCSTSDSYRLISYLNLPKYTYCL